MASHKMASETNYWFMRQKALEINLEQLHFKFHYSNLLFLAAKVQRSAPP